VRLLASEAAVRDFLAGPLGMDPADARIEFLTGGVSSTVIRVVVDGDCFVIKQALPQLRAGEAWFSRPERSAIEARGAEVLARIVPGSVLPVLRVVPEANAFTMACAPTGSDTWKADLVRGAVRPEVAQAVGELLGHVHARSAAMPDLATAFADRSFFTELRLEPYLSHTAIRHPDLVDELTWLSDRLLDPGICLVHGDYSPKNLLVTPVGGLLLLDHEVAHWGQPAFDVGFVLAHLCLKGIHFRRVAYIDAAADLLAAYRGTSTVADAATGTLGARTLAGLMLARVDGKSRVEYLAGDDDDVVRALAGRMLRERVTDLDAVFDAAREASARG
jgi:aminoglycoside phosphotransferase (APT) family kinase protein